MSKEKGLDPKRRTVIRRRHKDSKTLLSGDDNTIDETAFYAEYENKLTSEEQAVESFLFGKEGKLIKNKKPEVEDFFKIYQETVDNKGGYENRLNELKRIINRDKSWVREQRINHQEGNARARLLEGIIEYFSERFDWFGESSYVTPTTKYDDYRHHVDFVVEWDEKSNWETGRNILPKMAVDCTIARDVRSLQFKGKIIFDGIKNGKLAEIKYFRSESRVGEVGPQELIPKVVISLVPFEVAQLCQDLVKFIKNPNDEKIKQKLVNHKASLLFLKQSLVEINEQIEKVRKVRKECFLEEKNTPKKVDKLKRFRQVEERLEDIRKIIFKEVEKRMANLHLNKKNAPDLDYIDRSVKELAGVILGLR